MTAKRKILVAGFFLALCGFGFQIVNGGSGGGVTCGSPTCTVSLAGSGNGVLALSGNTSGTATLTAPAIAGTVTNNVISSNGFQVPVGAAATPSVAVGGTGMGLYSRAGTVLDISANGAGVMECQAASGSSCYQAVSGVYAWTSSTLAQAADTGISRDAAGVVDIGVGTQGTTTGKVKAAGYISVGTQFTQDTGCGTIVTSSGGATAGQFTTVGSTNCTTVITFGNTATSPNHWACFAHDLTTSGDYNNPHVSSNTTTATIVTGTIVSGDVIEFGCIGY